MIYHISIYKDKKDVILLIPNAKTEGGFSVEINKPVIIEVPYNDVTIGEKVMECLEVCKNEPIHSSKDNIKVFEIVTGIKSYSKFSKDRLTVTFFVDTEKGFTVLPLVRFSDGSYRPNKERYQEIKLELNATNEQIGVAIINRLELLKNR